MPTIEPKEVPVPEHVMSFLVKTASSKSGSFIVMSLVAVQPLASVTVIV